MVWQTDGVGPTFFGTSWPSFFLRGKCSISSLDGNWQSTACVLRFYRPSCVLWFYKGLIDRLCRSAWSLNRFALYSVSQKQHSHRLFVITRSNIDRFSKFFHFRTQQKICNKLIFSCIPPHLARRYTTLWNITVRKIACPMDWRSLAKIKRELVKVLT